MKNTRTPDAGIWMKHPDLELISLMKHPDTHVVKNK